MKENKEKKMNDVSSVDFLGVRGNADYLRSMRGTKRGELWSHSTEKCVYDDFLWICGVKGESER